MARALWTGAVSFGLVTIPVKAYTAVRDHRVHFHQLEKGTGARIRNEKVSDKTHDEVTKDDIELGYEISKGKYVTVDPDEVAELRPRTTKTIDVEDFVALADVDPVYYERTYWLAPDGEAAERAYHLLRTAMEERGRVGIGTVVMRTKQYLAAIRPLDGALALSTMRFADEVVAQSEIDGLGGKVKAPAKKERALAEQIIDSLSTEWDPSRYHDTYTEELESLLRKKAKGQEIVAEEPPEAEGKVLDLMAALEASLKESGRGPRRRAKKSSAKRSTSKASKRASGSTAKTANKKPAQRSARKSA
jgi:DNA end-binding protein Ku